MLISPQINAVLQIVILALLFASMGFKLKKKYSLHGTLALVATILNLLSFVLVMLPSVLSKDIVRTNPFHVVSIATLFHSTVGAIAMLLSVWLVAAWHLQSLPKGCFRRKNLMRAAIAFWMLSFALGFLLYTYLHTNLIP